MRNKQKMMRSVPARIGIAVIAVQAIAAAWQPSSSAKAIPDSALYSMMFRRIAGQKQFADRIQSQGHDGSYIHSELRNQIGLAPQDYAVVESTALDFVSVETANLMQQKSLAASLKQNPSDSSVRQQLYDLRVQERTFASAHVETLKDALGPAKFQQVDSWARTKVLPRIGYK